MSNVLRDLPDVAGKTVVITGANSGIGFEAARALAAKHADVILACRSLDRGRAAEARIRRELPDARLEVRALDLASLDAVREFALQLSAARPFVDILINNAGLMAIPRQLTRDGFEMQLGVNHFAHFALTGLLLPKLLAASAPRVINVASQAHLFGSMHWGDLDGQRNYHKWSAYGQSKLANLLFSFELDRRLRAKRLALACLAVHPGYAATNLQYVGPELEGSSVGMWMMRLGNRWFAQSAEGGALPTVYAALSPAAVGGEYIGPSGLFGRAGTPAPLRAKAAAYDVASGQRLWDVSVERTDVGFGELQ